MLCVLISIEYTQYTIIIEDRKDIHILFSFVS